MANVFDIIIFGASGFTGEFVMEEMVMNASKENITWAVAGRNRQKVQQVLERAQKNNSDGTKEIQILVADVTDQTSLENMCKKAKVIISCVGPYGKYGEAVILACLKYKTHLIDMSVEIGYISNTILRYFREAESQEVYIVTACGIGHLPLEISIEILQQKFEGTIGTIDCYITAPLEPKSVHFGTWESLVNIGSPSEFLGARQKIYSQIMNQNKSKWDILSLTWPIKFCKEVKGFCMHIPSMLLTSQLSLDMNKDAPQKSPIKVNTYVVLNSWIILIKTLVLVLCLLLLFPFSFGRWLLCAYPELFSFGVVSKFEMFYKKDVCNASLTCVAKGWSKKQHSDGKHVGNPDKTVTLHASGKTAYKLTATCLVQSAVVVLKETDRLPCRGGVYTPLSAFSETSMVSRLQDNGIAIQVHEN